MTQPKGMYPFRHTGKVSSHGDSCGICHNHNANKSKAKRDERSDIQAQLDDMTEEQFLDLVEQRPVDLEAQVRPP